MDKTHKYTEHTDIPPSTGTSVTPPQTPRSKSGRLVSQKQYPRHPLITAPPPTHEVASSRSVGFLLAAAHPMMSGHTSRTYIIIH